jgi:hypothetical protein
MYFCHLVIDILTKQLLITLYKLPLPEIHRLIDLTSLASVQRPMIRYAGPETLGNKESETRYPSKAKSLPRAPAKPRNSH